MGVSLPMAVAKYGETASTMLASPSTFFRSVAALVPSLTIHSLGDYSKLIVSKW